MKLLRLSLCFTLIALITACESSINNGQIPEGFLSMARQYEGEYSGLIENHEMSLRLSIGEDRVVKLEVLSPNDYGGLIPGCESTIGQLTNVKVDRRTKSLESATFALTNKTCTIDGREVTLKFSSRQQFSVDIAKTIESSVTTVCSGPSREETCWDVTHYGPTSWLTGLFSR